MDLERDSDSNEEYLHRKKDPGNDVVVLWKGKKTFDVVVAGVGLIVCAPIMAAIAISIRIADGKPILFRQERPGLNEEIFIMYKFRTMRNTLNGEHMVRSDAVRVTSLGSFLRRSSLDELPELINILKGDMSLVGPRPLLVEYLPKYSPVQRKRHRVRPGLTGLAQVNGRRHLTFRQRLELDVRYVESVSFGVDMQILLKTLIEPFRKGPDASQRIEDVDDMGFFTELRG